MNELIQIIRDRTPGKAIILILASLFCSAAYADSIVIGGRGSIVISGRGPAISPVPEKQTPPTWQPRPEYSQVPAAPVKSLASTSEPPAQQVVTERWLVSESWCPHCPAAKARFLASGGRADHVITIAQARALHGRIIGSIPAEYTTQAMVEVRQKVKSTPTRQVIHQRVRSRLPVVNTQWGRIDLETYNRSCNCPMCRGIRGLQQQYRMQQRYQSAAQEPTPDEVIAEILTLMDLQSEDVLCDLGCGDGRILIAATRRSGCTGVGVEIDPVKADEARQAVADAGMNDKITIITGDALDFDTKEHGVTALVTYLYPELLAKLTSKFASVRVGASPFHQVPGLPMTQHGEVWVYRG